MLLVLVCGNVALLLFARAATRESEIIVRSALGASRRRIIVQLFAEALVLGGVAAVVGLAAAHVALRQVGLPFLEMNMGQIPFWFDPRLSPATVLYACALTLLGAAIVGVVPGLKVTRGIGSRLRAGTTGGGGLRFGGVWTAVIVAQVAVTVAFPAIALLEASELRRVRSYDVGFAAGEYLAVQLSKEAAPGADVGRRHGGSRGPPRTIRDVGRDAASARRGRAGGRRGHLRGPAAARQLQLPPHLPGRFGVHRRARPRRGRRGCARRRSRTWIRRTSKCSRRRSSRGGDSRPPTSLPA